MGLPHWQWETYDRRPYLLWVPARPRLPARPAWGRKQMPSSPTAPLGDACPSAAHQVVPGSVALAAPLLSAQPRTFAPLGPAGPRSPGKPIKLPSTSACGQGAVRAGTQGTAGRSPRGHSPPQALVPGDWTWSSVPRDAGWHPLETVPSSPHHLPWALGALGGQASRPCPGWGEKNRLSIKGTAGHGGAEPSQYSHS